MLMLLKLTSVSTAVTVQGHKMAIVYANCRGYDDPIEVE
jgi:hypothetical protein